jgi:type VI secretion system protein ImpL
MRRILDILTSRWCVTLLAALVLGLLVWFAGPWIGFGEPAWYPLASEITRLVIILVIVLAWGAGNLIGQARVRRANQDLVGELKPDPDRAQVAGEEAELARSFERALARLGNTRFKTATGARMLYQLPWYVIIGPPGSGKTTALTRSGLHFPAREGGEGAEIRGVGGTRNCDWFFTSEAVLIDTAGRYTTQDSHAPVDRGAWQAFLDLLKKHRPRQPINGVLVAISASDLLAEEHVCEAHARAVRDRLAEISERLGVQVPVYLMLTKCDLISGFAEFFEDLDNEQRQQVWGATFAIDAQGSPAPLARGEFDRLLERLDERRLDRLHAETDLERRALIFGFPSQVALLGRPLESFIREAFTLEEPHAPRPRGFYLTSGTQEGTPIDRLVGSMAQTFGIERPPPLGYNVAPKPFFLTRLLRQVVFGEAGLVARDSLYERRERWTGQAAWGAAAVGVLAIGGLWWSSFEGNAERSLTVRKELRSFAQATGTLDAEEVPGTALDLRAVLPPLDALRALPAGYAERGGDDPWLMEAGLSQRDRLEQYGVTAYQRALYRLLLPRLVLRQERDIRAQINDPDYIFEALKVYLLLGQRETLYREDEATTEEDKALVHAWLDLDWQRQYSEAERARLHDHLAALLEMEPETEARAIALDGNLVQTARATLTRLPLSRRAYQLFSESETVAALPAWRAGAHVGPNAAIFRRRSGAPLDQGIPGQFTYDAFHQVVLDEIDLIAADVASEYWVLGQAQPMDDAQFDALVGNIRNLYYNDYIQTWDRFLADVTLKPVTGLDDALNTILVLSQEGSSPLQLLVTSVVRETSLTVPPPEPEPEAEEGEGGALGGAVAKQAAKMAKKVAGPAAGKAARLAKLAMKKQGGAGAGGAAGAPAAVPGEPVEAHFAYLKDLAQGVAGAPPALTGALASLGNVYGQLQTVLAAAQSGQPVPFGTGARELEAVAGRLPQPLKDMLGGVAESTASLGAGATRQQLDGLWRSEVVPLCRQALDGRFPFVRASGVDVNIDDFARLFAPGGVIDNFFNTHLRARVDTTKRPWRWRDVDGQALGISDGVLVQFERAARIRDGLFATGAAPRANFEMKPASLDQRVSQVRIDLDGQNVAYDHGPQMPTRLSWPGPGGQNLVRLSFAPIGGGPVTVTKEGAWSWFRLLNEASFRGTELSDRFTVIFTAGGYDAGFELTAGSIANPFDLTLFERFRCPDSF